MGHRSLITRRPQHVGEHVEVEPLEAFLRRPIWMRRESDLPAAPTERPRVDLCEVEERERAE